MMSVAAIIVCGGTSSRFGRNKLDLLLGDRPVWRWSVDAFVQHPSVTEVVVVGPYHGEWTTVAGGPTRQASVKNGLDALSKETEIVLVHDGARPLVSAALIDAVLSMVRDTRTAVIPGQCITDTIKDRRTLETVDRDSVVAVQTPQGARYEDLTRAYAQSLEVTDDAQLLTAAGVPVTILEWQECNIKLTTESDYEEVLRRMNVPLTRTGFGYDIHPFSSDESRPLWLGGVRFEGSRGLDGHSDADVLLHAITDALLGAAAIGDIGDLFPNTDPRWKNQESSHFLIEAAKQLRELGYRILNVDATLIAEEPKIGPRKEEMRHVIASALQIQLDQVCIKATTNERLGSLGRSEGIAAHAVAQLARNA